MQSGDLEKDSNGALEDTSPSSSSSSKTINCRAGYYTAPLMVEEPQPPECQEFDSEPVWHPTIYNGIVMPQTVSFFTMCQLRGEEM